MFYEFTFIGLTHHIGRYYAVKIEELGYITSPSAIMLNDSCKYLLNPIQMIMSWKKLTFPNS